jgi:hypothetical protein
MQGCKSHKNLSAMSCTRENAQRNEICSLLCQYVRQPQPLRRYPSTGSRAQINGLDELRAPCKVAIRTKIWVQCLVQGKTPKETKSIPYSANMYGSHIRYGAIQVSVQFSGPIRILTPNFCSHMNKLTVLNLSIVPSLRHPSFNTYQATNYIVGELQDLLPLNHCLTAFEIWWYTRRNQISSFGETDETI